jgi:hypothetical protein
MMGLTTQALTRAACTSQQLKSLNIDLTKTAPSQEDHYFNMGQSGLDRHGILFTSGSPKGEAVLKFLGHINYRPKQIVFINDKGLILRM